VAINNLFSAYEQYNINPSKKDEEKEIQNPGNNAKMVNNTVQSNISYEYLKNKVMTASKEELTLMLYDGAIRFTNKAILNINNENIQEAHDAIIRTQEIYLELMASLNKEYEIASSFHPLYEYIHNRLVEANMKKDVEILKEILGFSHEFRDTWIEAMKIAKKR
jgi:flagellar protein FliS